MPLALGDLRYCPSNITTTTQQNLFTVLIVVDSSILMYSSVVFSATLYANIQHTTAIFCNADNSSLPSPSRLCTK